MSPHRRVYINYSSTLEVMGTQLQMLEKQKMKALKFKRKIASKCLNYLMSAKKLLKF